MRILLQHFLPISCMMILVSGYRHRQHKKKEGMLGHGYRYRMLREKMRRSAPAEENCPMRDEAAAKVQGIECMTKCLSDHGCQNKRKLCLCDGVCGMSCIRPEKECPELPDPPNGQVHLTGRHFQVGYQESSSRLSRITRIVIKDQVCYQRSLCRLSRITNK